MAKILNSLRNSVSLCLAAGVVATANQAGAEEFEVILPGLNITNGSPAHVLDGGDTLFVRGTGSIIVAGIQVHATAATGDNNLIRNNGMLDASGSGADGIHMFGAYAAAQNGGLIQTTGSLGVGIWIQGVGGLAINSGTINLTGNEGQGIAMFSDGGIIVNSVTGEITTSGNGAEGILASGNDMTVYQVGRIETTGADAWAVWQVGDDATIYSYGDVVTGGDGATGINLYGDRVTITQLGDIDTAGVNASGIVFQGSDGTITIGEPAQIRTAGNFSSGVSVSGTGNTIAFESGFIATQGSDSSGIEGLIGSDNLTILMGQDAAISTQGTEAYGVVAVGDDVHVDARGTIVTSGSFAGGVFIAGDDAIINHSGAIRTTGLSAYGLALGFGGGDRGTVFNSGLVRVEGMNAVGIYAEQSNHVIDNSGLLEIAGANAVGIFVVGSPGSVGNSVTNSGLITLEGPARAGIIVTTDASEVLNSGEIRTEAGGAGILTTGNDVSVRNAGRIFAGTDAFNAAGSGAILRLDAGSILVGGITFGDTATATIDVGLPNAALTLTGVPANILSDGRPQLVVGNTLFVVDQGHFAALDRTGFSTLDHIGFTLDQRPAATNHVSGVSFWTSGNIGSASDADAMSGMLGVNFALSANRHAGVFIGMQNSAYETTFSSSQIDSSVTFMGATWGGTLRNGFFETALSFGTVNSDSMRRVANNTVPMGYEDAIGSTQSRFVGLSATFGTETLWHGMEVRPSLRLRYGWQQTDGFAEVGSQANMIIDDRVSQQLDLRAKVEIDLTPWQTDFGLVATTLYGGIDLGYRQADAVTATIAGQPMVFETASSGLFLQGFVGAQATIATRNGGSFALSAELGADGSGTEFRLGAMYSISF